MNEASLKTQQQQAELSPGCLLILFLTGPFISVLASMLDAWVVRLLLDRFTSWTLSFGEAFALSLIVAVLTARRSWRPEDEDQLTTYLVSLLYAFLSPPVVALTAVVAYWLGVGR